MSRGSYRPRKPRGRSRVGERFEAEVGPVAHGGHCVARLPEPEPFETVAAQPPQEPSRVVFVRHAIPGERVVVEITEGSSLTANLALVEHNARLGAAIAREYAAS